MSYEKDGREKKHLKKSKVFGTFENQYVNLVVKDIKSTGSKPGSINNLVLAGYFLDEDDAHYYLGQDENSVYAAVNKDIVVAIMLSDEAAELMEDIEVPNDQEVQ